MQRLVLAATLVLAVAGCLNETKTVSVDPYVNQIIPHNLSPKTASIARPAKQVAPRNLAPAKRAGAPEGAYESKETPLMDCMSEACKTMCRQTSRPKWCSYFKEPRRPNTKTAAAKIVILPNN
jgi:hypothetical protein